eukprot:CAMPEP_0194318812 /NCGR_PEP_ID=MMETSP0171-20130528/15353_1 /TAXON_ID=218684 /ORGANISM="Corethron pennatum, Strain L29A3" /LENGTH=459 /DNA_ID=CAMNT_0039075831 /DNA_START=145 /DNA_END=1524 /DNA_ORIENTATION=+
MMRSLLGLLLLPATVHMQQVPPISDPMTSFMTQVDIVPIMDSLTTPTTVPATPEPTLFPTSQPTTQVDIVPVMDSLTTSTTVLATPEPTLFPTSQPTPSPTLESTGAPITPSSSPSSLPTASPTSDSTSRPTRISSIGPTLRPSTLSSENPTSGPSSSPSSLPTSSPTSGSTIRPSPIPSISLTLHPSMTPSANPTSSLSSRPSYIPTASPTSSSTVRPTPIPSIGLTLHPATAPSANPTSGFSSRPSSVPTAIPMSGANGRSAPILSFGPTLSSFTAPSLFSGTPTYHSSIPSRSPVPSLIPSKASSLEIATNSSEISNQRNIQFYLTILICFALIAAAATWYWRGGEFFLKPGTSPCLDPIRNWWRNIFAPVPPSSPVNNNPPSHDEEIGDEAQIRIVGSSRRGVWSGLFATSLRSRNSEEAYSDGHGLWSYSVRADEIDSTSASSFEDIWESKVTI